MHHSRLPGHVADYGLDVGVGLAVDIRFGQALRAPDLHAQGATPPFRDARDVRSERTRRHLLILHAVVLVRLRRQGYHGPNFGVIISAMCSGLAFPRIFARSAR